VIKHFGMCRCFGVVQVVLIPMPHVPFTVCNDMEHERFSASITVEDRRESLCSTNMYH
jgi:hypothetical protein